MAKGAIKLTSHLGADVETRSSEYDHRALRLWLRMLATTNAIQRSIRERLRSEFAVTLPRFDLMAQLERREQGLSMGELSQQMMVTGGNVTGIVAALESEGLVVREIDPSDRRITLVKLSDVGRQSFVRMAKIHEAWIVDIFSVLSAKQQEALGSLLGDVKGSVLMSGR